MLKLKEIKLKIPIKAIEKLKTLIKSDSTLEAFLEDQILEMAIAKEFGTAANIAQSQIEAIQKGLIQRKEQLKKELIK